MKAEKIKVTHPSWPRDEETGAKQDTIYGPHSRHGMVARPITCKLGYRIAKSNDPVYSYRRHVPAIPIELLRSTQKRFAQASPAFNIGSAIRDRFICTCVNNNQFISSISSIYLKPIAIITATRMNIYFYFR